jgi:hypothetical protein
LDLTKIIFALQDRVLAILALKTHGGDGYARNLTLGIIATIAERYFHKRPEMVLRWENIATPN